MSDEVGKILKIPRIRTSRVKNSKRTTAEQIALLHAHFTTITWKAVTSIKSERDAKLTINQKIKSVDG